MFKDYKVSFKGEELLCTTATVQRLCTKTMFSSLLILVPLIPLLFFGIYKSISRRKAFFFFFFFYTYLYLSKYNMIFLFNDLLGQFFWHRCEGSIFTPFFCNFYFFLVTSNCINCRMFGESSILRIINNTVIEDKR